MKCRRRTQLSTQILSSGERDDDAHFREKEEFFFYLSCIPSLFLISKGKLGNLREEIFGEEERKKKGKRRGE